MHFRTKLIEDRDTILDLTAKIQVLQNEVNFINDSRDFENAESVRSGQSHVASQPVFFPPHPVPEGMQSRSIGMPSRKNGPSILDTHGISGNVFANPAASSSAPYPQELNPWSSHMSEPIHSSPAGNENQTPVLDPRCQSAPSAKNSVIFSGGDFSKNYGADQQRLQISDLHFDKFTTLAKSSSTCGPIPTSMASRGTPFFQTQVSGETPQYGLHQSGKESLCRVHDQARRRPIFQLMALGQALRLGHPTCKVRHGCHPTSPLSRWTFLPATFLQRPTLNQATQALIQASLLLPSSSPGPTRKLPMDVRGASALHALFAIDGRHSKSSSV